MTALIKNLILQIICLS